MKTYFLLALGAALAQMHAYGQAGTVRRWQFGLMAGPQFMNSAPRVEGEKWSKGFMAAADVSYRLQAPRKGWSVHMQPGINTYRTRRVEGSPSNATYMSTKMKSNTIYLPLLIHYNFLGGKVRPFAELGLNWRYGLPFTIESKRWACSGSSGCLPYDSKNKYKVSEQTRQLGALAAAGVEIDLGKITIPLTVRVIEDVKKKEVFDDPALGGTYTIPRSRVVQISAGITL
ncbi:outer membrane beta-barrel protein [Dyadobacter sandarakinus]|uniref:PorT family protein n=1 Tax=Dyadobacter sandarakinus TaxID=2747268 RepID=A0ABX7I2E8_9BACT|nr:outer membrane beta-barrel protein [Dyadobacter sandarakinus]QRR00244.1 PorT family protein [Dyadobacter sandarakinus]